MYVRFEVFTAVTEECRLLECDAVWHTNVLEECIASIIRVKKSAN
jgi:hypothetical protein